MIWVVVEVDFWGCVCELIEVYGVGVVCEVMFVIVGWVVWVLWGVFRWVVLVFGFEMVSEGVVVVWGLLWFFVCWVCCIDFFGVGDGFGLFLRVGFIFLFSVVDLCFGLLFLCVECFFWIIEVGLGR